MAFHFRPAKRSEAKPLIGIYARSGCGKTYSSLLLARGFVGPNGKIGMIETESGRGEAFADDPAIGGYIVCPIRSDFAPSKYGEALTAAEDAKLDALIIDSASHEWEGAGGVLSMAAKNQREGKRGPLVWQEPKLEHQRQFMLRLLGTPIPLVIICMRAKYPMEEVTKEGKKEWVRSTSLEPKQSEDILFEMFIHGWIDEGHRFHGTKYTRDDLRQVLVDGKPISIESGRRLAEWAREGSAPGPSQPAASEPVEPATSKPTDATERPKLVADIRRLGAQLRLSQDDGRALAREHLDTTDLNAAPVDKLTRLANALRKRANEPEWGEAQQQELSA